MFTESDDGDQIILLAWSKESLSAFSIYLILCF